MQRVPAQQPQSAIHELDLRMRQYIAQVRVRSCAQEVAVCSEILLCERSTALQAKRSLVAEPFAIHRMTRC